MKLIIDGNYTLYRAIYSSGDLSSSIGEPTGGIFKFLKMLKKYSKSVPSIKDIVVVFDGGRASYRKELFSDYKRRPSEGSLSEEELIRKRKIEFINKFTFSEVEEMLPLMGITTVRIPGEEADDVIFRLCEHFLEKGERVVALSDDEDYMQLINIGAEVFRAMKDVHVTKENYLEIMGHSPEKFIMYKSLIGDGSDNIEGVKGIGPATANKIIKNLNSSDLNELKNYCSSGDNKTKILINNSLDIVERNIKLIDIRNTPLTKETCASEFEKEKLKTKVDIEYIFSQFKRFEFSSLTGWISELSNY